MKETTSIFDKILKLLLGIGPGIFAIGYTIGTGSVTAMIVSGSTHGMRLLWALALSCIFSWVMIEAYGRFALVTGETALYSFRKHLKLGNFNIGNLIAILIIVGIGFGQWNSLMGILGISANAIFESLALFFPTLKGYEYVAVLTIAIIVISIMYWILWIGRYSIFEKILVLFVSLMGLSFIVSLFVVLPDAAEVVRGLVPSIPQVEDGRMLVVALVGTTMAAATFISRPLFIQGKGWTKENLSDQQKDGLWAALLIFIISGSIMAVATGALYGKGEPVVRVLDMVTALEPVAGKLAIAIFFLGTLAAGLSSVFPILMIVPLMIADYQKGELDTNSKQFKILTAIACIVGLAIPISGANPIKAQILTQIFNVFPLPLVIISMMILINRKSLMGEYKANLGLNIGMALALIFACIISYNGVISILDKL